MPMRRSLARLDVVRFAELPARLAAGGTTRGSSSRACRSRGASAIRRAAAASPSSRCPTPAASYEVVVFAEVLAQSRPASRRGPAAHRHRRCPLRGRLAAAHGAALRGARQGGDAGGGRAQARARRRRRARRLSNLIRARERRARTRQRDRAGAAGARGGDRAARRLPHRARCAARGARAAGRASRCRTSSRNFWRVNRIPVLRKLRKLRYSETNPQGELCADSGEGRKNDGRTQWSAGATRMGAGARSRSGRRAAAAAALACAASGAAARPQPRGRAAMGARPLISSSIG